MTKHEQSLITVRVPLLTVDALCNESCPAVGQSQPSQITELLQRSGIIYRHRLIQLARGAAKDTVGHITMLFGVLGRHCQSA